MATSTHPYRARRPLQSIQIRADPESDRNQLNEARTGKLGGLESESEEARREENMVAKVQRMRSRLEATTAERDALKAELTRLNARHELDCMDLRAENASLKTKLEKALADLDAAHLAQEAQQQACALLMMEQEHLEAAYEEALAEIDELRQAPSLGPSAACDPTTNSTDLGDTSWELLPETLPAPRRATIQRSTRHRFFSKKRQTPPKAVSSGSPSASRDQLAISTVRNDLEQMKSSIAMLARNRERQRSRAGGEEVQEDCVPQR
ncbi:hypothetical protein BMF94_4978 [Rhodotorula taiwanensis]|uniref:Uncharacterized protein n=1 Tax=Rhodotorula taiwanensis TaxID=741276 RepID=A0A2S5B5B3_9BASI|nr:hypothetical protein BMF94_4978 [Rhodotorula taiwanensis]